MRGREDAGPSLSRGGAGQWPGAGDRSPTGEARGSHGREPFLAVNPKWRRAEQAPWRRRPTWAERFERTEVWLGEELGVETIAAFRNESRVTVILQRLKEFGARACQSPLRRGDPPVDADPILLHTTPDSLLSRPTAHKPRFIAGRSRLATCSGVAWFHDDHIATINLAGNALHTYRFDSRKGPLIPVQALVGSESFEMPENLAFSPDGRRLAMPEFVGR